MLRLAALRLAALRLMSLVLALIAAPASAAAVCQAASWPQWQTFAQHFVQADGRVLDASTPRQISTSEGQSYAMFFALVANDRAAFERLWRWSVANLADADATRTLPAWAWGKRDDGSWGVLDRNAASDADLWFTYALLEAGRLWRRPDYTREGLALLNLIQNQELADLPDFGPMLLPAPFGFVQPDGIWRLNPSYLPIPVLRRLALAAPGGPWTKIAANTVRLIQATTPKGFAADWVAYQSTAQIAGQFVADPVHGYRGSYDAIRTYMWAGMTPAADPAAQPLRAALYGMAAATLAAGVPPESVQTDTGVVQGSGPFGFSAALLPYLEAEGRDAELRTQLARVRAAWTQSLEPGNLALRQPSYYDYVLSLFGTGWYEQRYRFGTTGRLSLEWEKKCP
ncbi:cellulase [Bordetella avium]|nr:cellulose synthase complex periplasmic endoglucanase BcsZ [Bordetella avium]RIQ69126.1 cellulase [Bordetella avium]